MNHGSLAFFSAVVRYLSLHFAPKRQWSEEYARLLRWLQDSDDQHTGQRPPWHRRAFRRVDFDDFSVLIWLRGIGMPGQITDLSAGGARLTPIGGIPPTMLNTPFILSCLPPSSDLRIDIPVRATSTTADGSVCVEFYGPPVLLHRRLNRPIVDHHSRDETQQEEPEDVAVARALITDVLEDEAALANAA